MKTWCIPFLNVHFKQSFIKIKNFVSSLEPTFLSNHWNTFSLLCCYILSSESKNGHQLFWVEVHFNFYGLWTLCNSFISCEKLFMVWHNSVCINLKITPFFTFTIIMCFPWSFLYSELVLTILVDLNNIFLLSVNDWNISLLTFKENFSFIRFKHFTCMHKLGLYCILSSTQVCIRVCIRVCILVFQCLINKHF